MAIWAQAKQSYRRVIESPAAVGWRQWGKFAWAVPFAAADIAISKDKYAAIGANAADIAVALALRGQRGALPFVLPPLAYAIARPIISSITGKGEIEGGTRITQKIASEIVTGGSDSPPETEAFRHEGMAGEMRPIFTEFGSGYRGPKWPSISADEAWHSFLSTHYTERKGTSWYAPTRTPISEVLSPVATEVAPTAGRATRFVSLKWAKRGALGLGAAAFLAMPFLAKANKPIISIKGHDRGRWGREQTFASGDFEPGASWIGNVGRAIRAGTRAVGRGMAVGPGIVYRSLQVGKTALLEAGRRTRRFIKQEFWGGLKRGGLPEIGLATSILAEPTLAALGLVSPTALSMTAFAVLGKGGYMAIKKGPALFNLAKMAKRYPDVAKALTKHVGGGAMRQVGQYIRHGKMNPAGIFVELGGGALGREAVKGEFILALRNIMRDPLAAVEQVQKTGGFDDLYNTLRGLSKGPSAKYIASLLGVPFGSGWIGMAIKRGLPWAKISQAAFKMGGPGVVAKTADLTARRFAPMLEEAYATGGQEAVTKLIRSEFKVVTQEGQAFVRGPIIDKGGFKQQQLLYSSTPGSIEYGAYAEALPGQLGTFSMASGEVGGVPAIVIKNQSKFTPEAVQETAHTIRDAFQKGTKAVQSSHPFAYEMEMQKRAREIHGSVVPEIYGKTKTGFVQEYAGVPLPDTYTTKALKLAERHLDKVAAHGGVVPLHFDLHSGNILRKGAQLHLIDWGLACETAVTPRMLSTLKKATKMYFSMPPKATVAAAQGLPKLQDLLQQLQTPGGNMAAAQKELVTAKENVVRRVTNVGKKRTRSRRARLNALQEAAQPLPLQLNALRRSSHGVVRPPRRTTK